MCRVTDRANCLLLCPYYFNSDQTSTNMRKLYLLLLAFYAGQSIFAQQSIGIGTTTPEYKLHILNPIGESSLGINATGTATASLLNLSIDNRIDGNALLLLKYRPGVAGTFAGIPRSNLSILAADAGAGPLLISTNQNSAMHFATNATERMRLTGNGLLGINTTSPANLLRILGRSDIPVSMSVSDTVSTGTRVGIMSDIRTTTATSAAIGGYTSEGVGVAGIELVTYGVLGLSGLNGYAVAGYSVGSTALRGTSTTGNALHTTGKLRLEGIGEAAGRVLTSNASGDATWQSISGTHNHLGEIWTGNPIIGLQIQTSRDDLPATALLAISTGDGTQIGRGIHGEAVGINGIGVWGANTKNGSPSGYPGSGIVGTSSAGPGVFGSSYSGYSIYGFKGSASANIGAVARFENNSTSNTSAVVEVVAAGNQPAMDIRNGMIKVSGIAGNKTAFTVASVTTGAGANTIGNVTTFTYNGISNTDIILLTHYWQSNYIGAIGVYWTGTQWGIFREDQLNMPNNEKFNVLVIKQ